MAERFVIVAHPRSGCHLLQGLLAGRGDLRTGGEVLKRLDVCGVVPRAGERVEDAVWRTFDGIIVHYTPDTEFQAFRDWAFNLDRAERYILLWRRDWLAVLVSAKVALMQGVWMVTESGEPPAGEAFKAPERCRRPSEVPTPRLAVSPVEARLFRDRFFARLDEARARLAETGRPYLEVTYEDLCQRRGETCERVQRFLGLDERDLEPLTCRQRTEPLSDVITNWDEVKDLAVTEEMIHG